MPRSTGMKYHSITLFHSLTPLIFGVHIPGSLLVLAVLYIRRMEDNVLFNDPLNILYLRLYDIGQIIKDH